MGRRVIRGDLSEEGIQSIIDQLNAYKVDLNSKCELFTKTLADRGIATAIIRSQVNEFGKYIQFTQQTVPLMGYGIKTLLIATQTGVIHREWLTLEGIKEVDVSPLLMAEFGSGVFADSKHRGTFPGQTHAFDDQWCWQDTNHEWHYSMGQVPSTPLYYAWIEMFQSINDVAREVFYG